MGTIDELITRLENSDGRVQELLFEAAAALRYQQQEIIALSNEPHNSQLLS